MKNTPAESFAFGGDDDIKTWRHASATISGLSFRGVPLRCACATSAIEPATIPFGNGKKKKKMINKNRNIFVVDHNRQSDQRNFTYYRSWIKHR